MTFYYIQTRMAKIKKTGNTKCWQGYGATRISYIASWNIKYKITLEISLMVSHTGKHTPNLWVNTYTFSFYPKESKVHVNKNSCTGMFIESLFIIANQPKVFK